MYSAETDTNHVSKALLQPLWWGRPWLKGPMVMRLNGQLSYKSDLERIILFDHNLGLILEGLAIISICLIR